MTSNSGVIHQCFLQKSHIKYIVDRVDSMATTIYNLYDDLVVRIVCSACTWSALDLDTLRTLSLTCKWLRDTMANSKKYIIEHYMAIVDVGDETTRLLYGELHSINDEPARVIHITPNNSDKRRYEALNTWYRHGKVHRDGDKPALIWEDGACVWSYNDRYHRDNDKPAMVQPKGSMYWCCNEDRQREDDKSTAVRSGGSMRWYNNGLRHREDDKPAIVNSDGSMIWYRNGLRHRDGDLPAAILITDGCREWSQYGQLHREGDQPAVIHDDGRMVWYYKDLMHRENNLPAFIGSRGSRKWFVNGVLHRSDDGPVYIHSSGREYWMKHSCAASGPHPQLEPGSIIKRGMVLTPYKPVLAPLEVHN